MKEMNDILHSFEDDGYAVITGFFPAEIEAGVRSEIENWVDRYARQLVAEGHIDRLYDTEPFETRLIRLQAHNPKTTPYIRRELHLLAMYDLFFHPPLLDIVEQILGPEIRLYPNYTVRPKLPRDAATEVLWHQDAAYTAEGLHGHDDQEKELEVDALRMVNIWTPLVPATVENGCMKFIPGTHKLDIVPHEKKEYYLQIVPDQVEPRAAEAVDIVVEPGDLVLFSNMLFHMGQPNRSDHIRWSCDWRYQDASQSTLRDERGHLARSRQNPDAVVTSAEQWARLEFV